MIKPATASHNETPTSETATNNLLVDQDRAAEILGLKNSGTLANWRSMRKGPRYVRLGRLVRYRVSDLLAWLDEQTVDPAEAD
ncbi:helix-turn-helix transcriptional regulator [Deferrisoma camini]|uniref:helix-turn-helix transcriptional regulator n=1 Tax=Deferrisoma camini TaxID=1035120 RepID=UPI00046CA397|nr:helix-turn-helix domain-containing protein [Deferrisoma camini]